MYKAILLSMLVFGCANLSVDVDDVCSSNDFQFPGKSLAVNGTIINNEFSGTVSESVDQDLSKPISDVKDVVDVSVTAKTLTLTAKSGDFNFVRHVVVTATQDNNNVVVADESFTTKTNVKSLNLTLKNSEKLTQLLMTGKVSLNVALTGNIPDAPTQASTTMCVGVNGEKSL